MMNIKRIASLINKLSSADPLDAEVAALTEEIASELEAAGMNELSESKAPVHMEVPVHSEPDSLMEQVASLHSAATIPAKNYARVASITSGLARAVEISRRPQYAAVRPRIAKIVSKLAGIFSEVDLAEDVSARSLEEIERMVHSLYSNGAQNKPSTYDFVARGKGHHNKP